MTIASETARVSYSGDGAVVLFPSTFKFLSNGDIKVILRDDATEVETVQVETTHYTLTGAGDASGGDVTMITAPATGETLVIKRDMTLTQGTDYVENDDFPAAAHETALDSVVMIAQQINERSDRSLHFKESSGLTDVELPDAEANKFLRWNTAADGFDNVTLVEGSLISSASEAVEGIAELATQTEVDTGTDDLKIVTPLKLKNYGDTIKTEDYILIQDQKASGTNGGTFTTGAYETRDLNTEVSDAGGHASIASNQITLAAGTYRFRASAPAYYVAKHRAKLVEDVGGTPIDHFGTSEFAINASGGDQTRSLIVGRFTIASSTVFEVQHRGQATRTTDGFGAFSNYGTEIYTQVELWKEN